MGPVNEIQMTGWEIINLEHLCTEFTPIIFYIFFGLEDHNLPRIVLAFERADRGALLVDRPL